MKPEKKTPFVKAWLPWYGDDFYGSFTVKSMSLEEEAVYTRWLWAAWCDNKCSLPAEEAALRKLSAGFAGDLSRLRSCWYLNEGDGRLYNERLLEVWHKAKELSRKRTAAVNTRYQGKLTIVATNVATTGLHTDLHHGYSSSSSPSSSSPPSTQKSDCKSLEAAAPKKAAELPDAAWFDSLKDDPAYRGLDIPLQRRKAEIWCKAHHRKLTRKFFTGTWLMRALDDRPIEAAQRRGLEL